MPQSRGTAAHALRMTLEPPKSPSVYPAKDDSVKFFLIGWLAIRASNEPRRAAAEVLKRSASGRASGGGQTTRQEGGPTPDGSVS